MQSWEEIKIKEIMTAWQTPNMWISEQWICYLQVGQRNELLGLARKVWDLMTYVPVLWQKNPVPKQRTHRIQWVANLRWDQNSQALFQAFDFSWECNLTSQWKIFHKHSRDSEVQLSLIFIRLPEPSALGYFENLPPCVF